MEKYESHIQFFGWFLAVVQLRVILLNLYVKWWFKLIKISILSMKAKVNFNNWLDYLTTVEVMMSWLNDSISMVMFRI